MKFRSGLFVVLALVATLGLAACGGDGVSDDTSFSEMNESEAQTLCEDLKNKSCTIEQNGSETTFELSGSCDEFSKQVADASGSECNKATAGDMRDCLNSCQSNQQACARYTACAFSLLGGSN